MNRTEKVELVNELTDQLKNHSFVYVTETSALSAKSTNQLRRLLSENGITMKVAKNTLIKLAMEQSGKEFGDLKGTLKGETALMFSDNMKSPAIAIKKFRESSEKPLLKGAFIDNDIYIGDDQLTALSKLKTREELIGELIGLLQSPAKNVISALQSSKHKVAGIVKTLQDKN